MATSEVRLIRSPISVVGMWLTTVTAVTFLVVFLADLLGLHTNPYIGILFFLVLPSFFLFGLILQYLSLNILIGENYARLLRRAKRKSGSTRQPKLLYLRMRGGELLL